MANAKFEEVGLDVSVVNKLVPQVLVQSVHQKLSPSAFMDKLYEMNLKALFFTRKEFDEGVRLASKPWADAASKTNIILKGCMDCFLRVCRVSAE